MIAYPEIQDVAAALPKDASAIERAMHVAASYLLPGMHFLVPLVTLLCACLALAPAAWAATKAPVKGAQYEGTTTREATILAGGKATHKKATSKTSRELLDQLLARAREAGQLRPDVTVLDIAWLIEMLGRSGPAEPSDEDVVIKRRLTAIAISMIPGSR